MDELISKQDAIDAHCELCSDQEKCNRMDLCPDVNVFRLLPSAQPELIEKEAYIRGFEQGRTQGMIDSQGGKK